ncbi:MAG TPA: ABC transporter permease, partial [Candidatus Woesebacteria bacterium]|nr:ABC transporter permease [Candidatus Woesebacteria bacterium]
MLNIKPDLNELVKSATHSILKNKSRTFLTSLGIIIGVTSVILLISIGNGLKSYITDQFESLGSNTIYIVPGKILSNNGNLKPGEATGILNITFTEKDVQNLQRELPVAAVL